jgi:hypothetical protein
MPTNLTNILLTLILSGIPTASWCNDIWSEIRSLEVSSTLLDLASTVDSRIALAAEFDLAAEVVLGRREYISVAFPRLVEEASSNSDCRSLFFVFRALGLSYDTHANPIAKLIQSAHSDPGLLVEISDHLAKLSGSESRAVVIEQLLADPKVDWVGVRIAGHRREDMTKYALKLLLIWKQDDVHPAWSSVAGSLSIFDRQNIAEAIMKSKFTPPELLEELRIEASQIGRPPLLTISCLVALAAIDTTDVGDKATASLVTMCKNAVDHGDGSVSSALRYFSELPQLSKNQQSLLELASQSDNAAVRRNAVNVLVSRKCAAILEHSVQRLIENRDTRKLQQMLRVIAAQDESQVPIRAVFDGWNKLDIQTRELAFIYLLRRSKPENTELVRYCCDRIKLVRDKIFLADVAKLEQLLDERKLSKLVPGSAIFSSIP